MTPKTRILFALLLVLLVAPARLHASKVMKISDDRYLVSDQSTTAFSGTGAMKRKVYRLSASLCVGLGYEWMLPLAQEAGGGSFGDSNAAASMEVVYFGSEGEAQARSERVGGATQPVECGPLADEAATRKLLNKLKKQGDL